MVTPCHAPTMGLTTRRYSLDAPIVISVTSASLFFTGDANRDIGLCLCLFSPEIPIEILVFVPAQHAHPPVALQAGGAAPAVLALAL
jgi:hypothetical protein